MKDQFSTLLSEVVGDDVELRTDTPLAILGWDDASWHALGAKIAATYSVEIWVEPVDVLTIGDLLDWMRVLVEQT